MKLNFVLFKYFPYGGLQRVMLDIANACVQRKHQVTVYTTRWQGERPNNIEVVIVPAKGWSNHSKYHFFSQKLQSVLAEKFSDLVVGFDKVAGLDVYYAANLCFAAKAKDDRSFFYRLTPRYHKMLALERLVFDKQSQTQILVLSEAECRHFQRYYQTPANRFFLLPPGISRNYIATENFYPQRQAIRQELSIGDDDIMLLALGSGFKTKGLDRSIKLLAALSQRLKVKFIVVGQDNPRYFERLAKQCNVVRDVQFLSGRDDAPAILQAADVLLHPAYRENTGNVLLEALVAGLPVVATDVCGYAHYVENSNMGEIITSPFNQEKYCAAAERVLKVPRDEWRVQGQRFAHSADIYNQSKEVVKILETIGENRGH